MNTRKAAEDAERAHIESVPRGEPVRLPERKEAPKYVEWADQFLKLAATKNKPSEIATKETILRVHLKPAFGSMRLDKINFAATHDFIAEKLASGLSKKSVNNYLTVLLRQGELLALRWEDVDLVKGQLHVRRSVTRDIITEPKSNRARMIRSARRRGAP